MSAFENAWKTLFGDATDKIDEAGDAQQARIVQAIDLINNTFADMGANQDAATDEFINSMRNTFSQMKSEIRAGNLDSVEKLKEGLNEQLGFLERAYNFTEGKLENAYKVIEGNILQGRDTARSDITSGRDAALGTLRGSLTDSLNMLGQGTDEASKTIRDSLQRTRQTYAPYIAAGQRSVARMEQLANDPEAQREYVMNNPFFSAMQETARDELFANQAARGRLGTGGTLDELDKRTLLLGEQLVGNAFARNESISNQGLIAGASQTQADTSLSNTLAQILANEGVIGANLYQNYGINAGNTQMRAGEGLADVSMDASRSLANVGTNFGGMLQNTITNLTNMGSNAYGNAADAYFNLFNNQTQQLASLTGQEGATLADARMARNNYNNNLMQAGANANANLLLGLGESEANEAIGEQAAARQQTNDLMSLAAMVLTGMNVGGFGNGTPGGGGGGGGGGGVNLGPLYNMGPGGGFGSAFPYSTGYQPRQPTQVAPFTINNRY